MRLKDPNCTENEWAPSLSRRFRLLLVGLVLARGLADLCAMPPFEGWDEYQHVGYVVHVLETGRPAVLGKTLVPQSLLLAMSPTFPQPDLALQQLDRRFGTLGYRDYWLPRVAGSAPPSLGDPAPAANRPQLYQAQHSWLYYTLVAPLFNALGGVHDLRMSVAGLRLLNLLLAAAAVWLVLGVLASRVRCRRTAAWIGLAVAAQPLFLINALRVSSDALGVFLATVVVALAMVRDDRRLTWRFGVMGVVMGLAILAKATNWSLLPLVAGSWLFVVVRNRTPVRWAVASALGAALGVSIIVGPEIRTNLATYGVPFPMQEAIFNHQLGRGFWDVWRIARTWAWFAMARWFWLQGVFIRVGWSLLEPSPRLVPVYYWSVVAGILGWGWYLARAAVRHLGAPLAPEQRVHGSDRPVAIFDSIWTPMVCVLFCGSVTAALGYHAIQSMLAWGVSTTGAWYAAAAIPWFQVVAVGGALAWPSRPGRALAALLIGSYVVVEQAMFWRKMLPTYSGGVTGLEALGRIAKLQPPFLGTATCLMALAAAGLLLIAAGVSMVRLANPQPARPTAPLAPGLHQRQARRSGTEVAPDSSRRI